MSAEISITKENLDAYLKELAKEFRKLNGTKTPAEIILIGGAAVIANYGFRELTNDIDAMIFASSAMKEAINIVGDRHGLPNGWLNADFKRTKSFSEKLLAVSKDYMTFSNILEIRTIAAEYLIAMKLMSGREHKYDLSDIVGILLEHDNAEKPISKEDIGRAVRELYGGWKDVPKSSVEYLETVFADANYAETYLGAKEREKENREVLLEFDKKYPSELTGNKIEDIIRRARQNKAEK
jgi:hypothetical protein